MAEFNLTTALAAARKRNAEAIADQEDLTVTRRATLAPDSPRFRIQRAAEQETSLQEQLTYLRKLRPRDPDEIALIAQRVGVILERIAELAAEQEASLQEQLTYLRKLRPRDPDEIALIAQRVGVILERIAELAAEQGDYKRAATIAAEPERRAHYQKVVAAIKVDDAQECACPDEVIRDHATNTEFRQSSMLMTEAIVTEQGTKNLEVCRVCGFANAR
jgi:hypothetical protein